MAFLLDANVFIEAHQRYYGFDTCPGFWEWILRAHDAGTVFSVEAVEAELIAIADELAEWIKALPDGFFLKPGSDTVASMQQLSNWATSENYEPAAVTTFLQAADYYLVAHALADGHTVVTQEVVSPSMKRIKIPNACIGAGVPYVNTFQMLRVEQARFVLP